MVEQISEEVLEKIGRDFIASLMGGHIAFYAMPTNKLEKIKRELIAVLKASLEPDQPKEEIVDAGTFIKVAGY